MRLKRTLSVLLALLAALWGAALAEDLPPDPDPLADAALTSGVPVTLDLDGDGAMETLTFTAESGDEILGEFARIEIVTAAGNTVGWNTQSLFSPTAHALDLDGDGVVEIFITGDWASADYATYCTQFAGGEPQTVRFADASRGGDGEGYEDYGYGYIVSATGGELTLCGSQDVLGTYFGTRTFALRDGAFEFADDGLWHFDTSAVDWENRALDPIADIPATFVDGGAETAGAIEAGTRFAVAASDKVSIVYFVTEDGREGFFPIEPDPRGWGVLVNGVSEDELFAFVPYAD